MIGFVPARPLIAAGLLAAVLVSPLAFADQLEVRLSLEHEPEFSRHYGADDHEAMQQNIQAQVSAYRFEGVDRLSPQRIRDLADDAREQAAEALRPFGYYHAGVVTRLQETGTPGRWLLELDVQSGPPVRVDEVSLRINGEGREDPVLRQWLDDWPLPRGAVLDQRAWRAAKNQGLEVAGSQGYLQSGYPTRRIELDLPARTARIELVMNTGERAVMGEVRYPEMDLDPRLLENMPRFEPGEPYRERLVTLLREDLVKSGWFDHIEIREEPHLDEIPPRVDLDVSLGLRPPNTWQTTVGFGTDTGPRLAFNWRRHLWSERGDSWHAGVGARESDREFVLFGEYRRPMLDRPLDAWTASARIRFERDQVRFLD
ncbi:MAG: POTRA domain-containing protein, partial [Xanthomonadales bacterium]|nr:POTRA domain-containing protein [Xanthomonadales bacterium]